MDQTGCIQRPGKRASVTVYLMEELGDARMRCDQLVRYVDEAVQLLEKTPQEAKETFLETAGHLTQAIPDTLFKVQQALKAVALAATRMDYEEIKDDLRPEKVDELERVLQDVRLRHVRRRSQPWDMQTLKAAAYQVSLLQQELSDMEQRVMTGNSWKVAYDWTSHLSKEVMQLASPEQVREKFKKENPALDDSQLDEIVGQWMKNKDVVKDKTAASKLKAGKRPTFDEAKKKLLDHLGKDGWKLSSPTLKIPHATSSDGEVRLWFKTQAVYMSIVKGRGGSHTMDGARSIHVDIRDLTPEAFMSKVDQWSKTASKTASDSSVRTASDWKVSCDENKHSRHEQGKPADPTKDMSPEDAEKWKAMNDEHGDKFKTAGDDYTGKVYVIWVEKGGKRHKEGPFTSTDRYRDARAVLTGKLGNPDVKSVMIQRAEKLASSDEDKQSKFEEGKPADPTKEMSPEDAKEWKQNTEEHKDDFKSASWKVAEAPSADCLKGSVESIEKACKDIKHHLGKGEKTPWDDVSQLLNSIRSTSATMLRRMGKTASDDEDKQSKFEEGKPADPTENMSPEDAKEWKLEHEKNKDNFKSASYSYSRTAAFTEAQFAGQLDKLAGQLFDLSVPVHKASDNANTVLKDAMGQFEVEGAYDNPRLREVRDHLHDVGNDMKRAARDAEFLSSVLRGKKSLGK